MPDVAGTLAVPTGPDTIKSYEVGSTCLQQQNLGQQKLTTRALAADTSAPSDEMRVSFESRDFQTNKDSPTRPISKRTYCRADESARSAIACHRSPLAELHFLCARCKVGARKNT